MAFSTKTWNVGDVLTAADMNQYVRDAMLYLHGDAGVIALANPMSLTHASNPYLNLTKTNATTRTWYLQAINDAMNIIETVSGKTPLAYDIAIDTLTLVAGAGKVKANAMSVHRHPYSNDRHMESGSVNAASLASMATTNTSVTFTDAFSAAPNIATGVYSGGDTGGNTPSASISGGCWLTATSTTGFTIYMRNHSNGTLSLTFFWIAEGAD